MREARIAWLGVAATILACRPALAQSWSTTSVSRAAVGAERLDVRVRYGAGTVSLAPAEAGLLYRMKLRYDEDAFTPVHAFDGHRLTLGVESAGRSARLRGRRSGGELAVELGRGVPIDLTLELGAVRANLDLGGLDLTGLDLSTGASESTVDVSRPNRTPLGKARFAVGAADFTARHLGNLNAERIEFDAGVGSLTLFFDGEWSRDATAAIDLGLGALELRLPKGLGVRLRPDSFLTSLDARGMVERGNGYESADWETAERRLTIELDAAFGSVEVRWIR